MILVHCIQHADCCFASLLFPNSWFDGTSCMCFCANYGGTFSALVGIWISNLPNQGTYPSQSSLDSKVNCMWNFELWKFSPLSFSTVAISFNQETKMCWEALGEISKVYLEGTFHRCRFLQN
jgi:hypothetical protein